MGISLSHVLLTHWHGDHTGGVPDLLRLYPHLENSVYKNQPERNQQGVKNGQLFRVDGATIRALHVPGHSADHMCFILEEEMAMFTGDNVLGHGTTVVEDLGIFMDSLRTMHAQRCGIGYSAHGIKISDLPSKIQGDLRSRLRREKQVMEALDSLRAAGVRSATVKEIVAEVYGTSVDETTRTLALEPFIDEVLRKLAGDYRVGFQIRGGKKTWYSVEEAAQQNGMRQAHRSSGPTLTDVKA